MNITTRFSLGDTIWIRQSRWVGGKCPACGGEGKLRGIDGEMYECSACVGDGETLQLERHVVHGPLHVDFIEVNVGKKLLVRYSVAESFMDFFNEELCHVTESEAQDACDRWNGEHNV